MATRQTETSTLQPQQHQALHTKLHQAAVEIGRLKRRLPADTLAEWTLDQIARHIHDSILIVEPSAAQISAQIVAQVVLTTDPGKHAALTEAIRIVDQRDRQLRRTLGLEAA